MEVHKGGRKRLVSAARLLSVGKRLELKGKGEPKAL